MVYFLNQWWVFYFYKKLTTRQNESLLYSKVRHCKKAINLHQTSRLKRNTLKIVLILLYLQIHQKTPKNSHQNHTRHFHSTTPTPHSPHHFTVSTHNSLLYPFMMRVEQRPAEIHSQLWRVNEFVQFFDRCADYHFETKFFFEELAADFGDGFLEEAGRSDHEDALNETGKEILRKKKVICGIYRQLAAVYSLRSSLILIWPAPKSFSVDRWSAGSPGRHLAAMSLLSGTG